MWDRPTIGLLGAMVEFTHHVFVSRNAPVDARTRPVGESAKKLHGAKKSPEEHVFKDFPPPISDRNMRFTKQPSGFWY